MQVQYVSDQCSGVCLLYLGQYVLVMYVYYICMWVYYTYVIVLEYMYIKNCSDQ